MYHITVCNKVDDNGIRWDEQIVKSYPHKIQCLTWLLLRGYCYEGRKLFGWDKRFRILEDIT